MEKLYIFFKICYTLIIFSKGDITMNNPKYCQKCGYVDLSGIENECPFCEKETLETEETYDELKKSVDNRGYVC